MSNISKILFGFPLKVIMTTTAEYKPEKGHAWMILGGQVAHVNGTTTHQKITDVDGNNIIDFSIDTSVEDGIFPLGTFTSQIGLVFTLNTSSLYGFIITDQMAIKKSGDAAVEIDVMVLDFLST